MYACELFSFCIYLLVLILYILNFLLFLFVFMEQHGNMCSLFAVGDFVNVEELEGYQVLANNSLLLQRPSKQDEGWFRCTAANEG